MSTDADAQIVSVIGGCKRAGRWLVPAKTTVMTFFGKATIDLREAETTAESLSFKVTSAFASVTFIVPEGAEVRPSGMAILASARSDVPVDPAGCQLPKIAIDAVTALGRFRIVTDAEFAEEEEEQVQAVAAPVAEAQPVAPVDAPVPAAAAAPAPVDDGPVDMVGSSLAADTPASPTPSMAAPLAAPAPEPVVEAPKREVSPIHDVQVPDSLAGAGLDDLPAPFPTDLEDDAVPEPT